MPRISIAAVILDMDGLMLDTEQLYKRAWQAAAAELGFDLDDAFYFTLVGRTNAAGERMLADRFGAAFPVETFGQRWADRWHQEVERAGIPLKPGLRALLDYAAAAALSVAVATSSDQDYADFSLRMAGLDPTTFAAIVTGDQVEHGKPAPDMYLEAARRLGIQPEHCLAIEDSNAGVLSAHTAGMLVVQVPDVSPSSAEATAVAFHVLPSLHEVVPVLRVLSLTRDPRRR